jgi:hypothetical protein
MSGQAVWGRREVCSGHHMNADWYPGIRAFCTHWGHAQMLQHTFEALEREFNDNSDASIDAAKAVVECACRVIVDNLDNPTSPA